MSTHTSKHLINVAEHSVSDSLQGLVAVNTGLQLVEGYNVVVRRDIQDVKEQGQVTLVSGGGSGHEPAFAGYVGPGMLSAAVCGSVFASPSPASILAALRAVGKGNKAGTLLIILNYTGDRLNFGLASERAKSEGLLVEMIVVGEDCALTSADKTAGRRGLAGTILVLKIAGALAAEGRPLAEISQTCQNAAKNMGTIGLSLTPCSIPGQAASFQLGPEEMELGLGVHGEAGVRRVKLSSAKEAVDMMLSHMTNPSSVTHLAVQQGKSVVLVVNNLGGTPALEINIMAREAIDWLEARGLTVARVYCGPLLTSLEMAGLSLSVLYLSDGLLEALDAKTSAIGWCPPLTFPGPRVTPPTRPQEEPSPSKGGSASSAKDAATVSTAVARVLYKAVAYACEALGNCEAQLNALDRQGGDGDCGVTLKRGADAILVSLGSADSSGLPVSCPYRLLLALSNISEEVMGGSSGGLYSLFLTAAASSLFKDTTAKSWCEGLKAGIDVLIRYGGAEPGDRTMLDSLDAAHKALVKHLSGGSSALDAFGASASAAEQAAIATASLRARAGRASYVSSETLTQPDPGAHAVGIWMRAAYEACKLLA